MFDKFAIYKRIRRYRLRGRLEMDAPMSRETSFKIGGPADILFCPDGVAEAIKIVKLCRRDDIALTILGNGTNLLVRDGGVRGIVIKTGGLRVLRCEGERVYAGAGVDLNVLCNYAKSEGLSGVEFACGVPGSVGGAVYMNAGAYGSEIKDVAYRSVALENDGSICAIDNIGHGFSYRKSIFQKNGNIILETEFLLKQSSTERVSDVMRGYMEKRIKSQPLDVPNAGSVFKRPDIEGAYVGAMIEQCGLKGCGVGGARVSAKHAGFIVNAGGATASDVLNLIEHIRAEVFKRFSIELEMEIKVIGDGI